MKKLLLCVLVLASVPLAFADPITFNATVLAELFLPSYGGCAGIWGDGEVAIVALRDGGLSLADLSDPSAPIETARWNPGNVFVQDVKMRAGYAAASNETYDGNGVFILDISNPYLPFEVNRIEVEDGIEACASVWFDPTGFLYCAITSVGAEDQVRIYDARDVQSIVQVGAFEHSGPAAGDDVGISDMMVQDEILYMAWLEGGLVIADVSDPSNPIQIGENVFHASSFTSNAWPTESGGYVLTTDEIVGGHVRVWDVRDPGAVVQVGEYVSNTEAIVHKVHVKGDLAYVAYYEEGVRIVDIADPTDPVEVAFHDTFVPETEGEFDGTRGVWPFASEGNEPGESEEIYLCDLQGKMVVVELDGPRRARLSGTVEYADDGSPVSLATIRVSESGRSVRSDGDGEYTLSTGATDLNVEVSGFEMISESFEVSLAPGDDLRRDVSAERSPSPAVVIADDDGGSERQHVLEEWLDELDLAWLTWDAEVDGPLPPARIDHFDPRPVVIWMTGDAVSATLGAAERDSVGALLDMGCSVCLNGQYIGDELGPSDAWLMERFGAEHVEDLVTVPILEGVEGDPITSGMLLRLDAQTPERAQLSPGEVATVGVAEPILAYAGSERFAGVRRELDGVRTIFLEFGLEGIDTQAGFTEPTLFLRSLLTWLGVPLSISKGADGPPEPISAHLLQNTPNPFNPNTTIRFRIPEHSPIGTVRLTIHDVTGRLVATLLDRPLGPGLHAIDWNGIGPGGLAVASGRYVYTLETPGRVERRSMLVLK